MDGEEENSSLIRAVSRAHDRCLQAAMKNQSTTIFGYFPVAVSCVRVFCYFYLPMEKVVTNRAGAALSWRVAAQVVQLLVDSLQRHCEKTNLASQLF